MKILPYTLLACQQTTFECLMDKRLLENICEKNSKRSFSMKLFIFLANISEWKAVGAISHASIGSL